MFLDHVGVNGDDRVPIPGHLDKITSHRVVASPTNDGADNSSSIFGKTLNRKGIPAQSLLK